MPVYMYFGKLLCKIIKMVDLSTYRCRIGRFHRLVRLIVDAGKWNFDAATIQTIGALCFISLLLFCSGIELNPGPRTDQEQYEGEEKAAGSEKIKSKSTVMSSQQQRSASMEMSLPCSHSGQEVGLLEDLYPNAAEAFPSQQQQQQQKQHQYSATVIRTQTESPPGERFVNLNSTQGDQPSGIQQETGLEKNPGLPPPQIYKTASNQQGSESACVYSMQESTNQLSYVQMQNVMMLPTVEIHHPHFQCSQVKEHPETDGSTFPKKTEHSNNECQHNGTMSDVENFRMGEEVCGMTSNNRKYGEAQLEDLLTAQYSHTSLRNASSVSHTDNVQEPDIENRNLCELPVNIRGDENDQEEAKGIVRYDSRSALDAESETIPKQESEIQNIGSTKIYDLEAEKIEKDMNISFYEFGLLSEREGNLFSVAEKYKLALKYKKDFKPAQERLKLIQNKILKKKEKILHAVVPTKHDEEEIKHAYNEQIKSIKKSKSLETVFERLFEKAECKNEEAGQVMYEVLLDLKPNFVDDCVCEVHDNQKKCVWNPKEMMKLKKITNLQLRYDDKPSVTPFSAVTYGPFPPLLCRKIAATYANFHTQNAKSFYASGLVSRQWRQSGSKIKLGYISSDFRNHSMSHLISGLFSLHDRKTFEVFSYAIHADDGSEFRKRIREGSDHFRDIFELDLEGRKRCIEDDGIDILINLNGYTCGADNELFSLKLAPVQVMWLGFPGTSGSDYMDYLITDPVSTPVDCANDFSEKLAYLPPTHFVGDHLEMFSHLIEKIEIRLSAGGYCFNSILINGKDLQPLRDACQNSGFMIEGDKKHGEVIIIPYIYILISRNDLCCLFERCLPLFIKRLIWSNLENKILGMREKLTIFGVDILNGLMIGKDKEHIKWSTGEVVPEPLIFTARSQYGLPDDKVVFANFNQNYKYDKVAADMWIQILRKVPTSVLWLLRFDKDAEVNFREYIRKSGEDIADGRIVFSDIVKKEEYIRRAQLADVFLDTPLCNAHTTCMDAIFAGLPVVTLPKRKLASRIAASIVKELGCEELIAKNKEDYVDITVQLGNNPRDLRGMKNKVFARVRESSLFDVPKKVKLLEELFKCMYHRSSEQSQHITDLVSNELKMIPPRQNTMHQGIIVQFEGDHLSLQGSGKQEYKKNLTPSVNLVKLPVIIEEHESEDEADSGNTPLLGDIR